MEANDSLPVELKRPPLTPKALIHQKYGPKACFKVEEVQQMIDNGCPGLVISQARFMYRCYLDLPELSVSSGAFARKKDAEQAAAKIAIEKLGIQTASANYTPDEAISELVARISGLFLDEFLLSTHPLVSHIRAALKKGDNAFTTLPASVIAAYDMKINSLCKIINSEVDLDPLLGLLYVMMYAKNCESVLTREGELWISKRGCYSQEALQLLPSFDFCHLPRAQVSAVYIPCSVKEPIRSTNFVVSNNHYYLDDIAEALGTHDISQVLISRTVGKASSETKIYFCCPKLPSTDLHSTIEKLSREHVNSIFDSKVNTRASYLSGQKIYGDAILANVGYTWKSSDLHFEDVSLCSYYRMLLSKMPDGYYKLNSGALLATELPTTYNSRSNWRGPSPKDVLCTFCRQHRLLEPVFSVKHVNSLETSTESLETFKKPKSSSNGVSTTKSEDVRLESCSYKCEVKIFSRRNQPIVDCSCDEAYTKEVDSIQNASLRILNWFKGYFKQIDLHAEKLCSFGRAHGVKIYPEHFLQAFSKCLNFYRTFQDSNQTKRDPSLDRINEKQRSEIIDHESLNSGRVFRSPGSIACISYSVRVRSDTEDFEEILESQDELEFEIGTGSVINQLEQCVSRLSANQIKKFLTELPSRDLILAASGESAIKFLQQLSFEKSKLEYTVSLLHVSEPLEERMEQALFSPPLSKQRLEFALRYIRDSHATTLVDFGCGAGSLLDSLLDHATPLQKIVGIDVSLKSLSRAAKTLHLKLSNKNGSQAQIRSVILCDGSITKYDARFHEPDISTCLEVIEHMEEDQADLFGDVALGSFHPLVLIVSTPNYEYNPLLQKGSTPAPSPPGKDVEIDVKCCRFRNHDHKFEWTREQFQRWASGLAARHSYTVEFGGVGGDGDFHTGFASQIAVFRRNSGGGDLHSAENSASGKKEESPQPYQIIWEWNRKS